MAVISHIPALELAFENGNRKFLISEILNFSAKNKTFFYISFLSEISIISLRRNLRLPFSNANSEAGM